MSTTWLKQAVFERATSRAEYYGINMKIALNLWIYLHLSANIIALTLLVATFLLAKTVHRHPVLINMCVTFVLFGIFSNMLWFTGHHVGPEPSRSLCITQTSFLYGSTPMMSLGVFGLVYYVSDAYHGGHDNMRPSRVKVVLLLVSPYIALATFAISTAILSVNHPHAVNRKRRFFHCSLLSKRLTCVMGLFTLTVLLVVTILEFRLGYSMYKNRRTICRTGRLSSVQMQFVLRVLMFGFYVFMGMVISVASMAGNSSPVPELFCATTGLSTFLIFGTQRDVLNTWAFWRHYSKPDDKAKPVHHPRDPTWILQDEKFESLKGAKQANVTYILS